METEKPGVSRTKFLTGTGNMPEALRMAGFESSNNIFLCLFTLKYSAAELPWAAQPRLSGLRAVE